jgi:hypothetical protein
MQRNALTDSLAAFTFAPMPLSPDQLTKLREWWELCVHVAFVKAKESKLRDELVKEFFNADKDAGTETIEIANGYKLKSVKKLDYKLNNKEGAVTALVAIIDPELAQKLVKWTPKLSESTYKNLDPQTQKLFDGCLTIKPGKPSLKIIPPGENEAPEEDSEEGEG